MNCRKAKELMIAYPELALNAKTSVDIHLENCTSCARVFLENQRQQENFERAQSWNPEIKNPVAFTDRIIAALPPKRKDQRIKLFFSFNWTPLQTSLAACSLILAISFIIEFNTVGENVEQQVVVKNGVPLSINPEKLIQSKRNRTNLFSLEKMIIKNSSIAYSE